ncbi:MAG: hypothetical protein ACRC31_06240 [Cetobacterium sp.]
MIINNMATLNELKTVYTYSDCIDMLEIIAVNNYNQYAIMERSKNG